MPRRPVPPTVPTRDVSLAQALALPLSGAPGDVRRGSPPPMAKQAGSQLAHASRAGVGRTRAADVVQRHAAGRVDSAGRPLPVAASNPAHPAARPAISRRQRADRAMGHHARRQAVHRASLSSRPCVRRGKHALAGESAGRRRRADRYAVAGRRGAGAGRDERGETLSLRWEPGVGRSGDFRSGHLGRIDPYRHPFALGPLARQPGRVRTGRSMDRDLDACANDNRLAATGRGAGARGDDRRLRVRRNGARRQRATTHRPDRPAHRRQCFRFHESHRPGR